LITYIYYLTGKGIERFTYFLAYNIEKVMLSSIYTKHFDKSPKISLKFDARTKSLDSSHLTEFIIPANELIPGREYLALFRFSDAKMV